MTLKVGVTYPNKSAHMKVGLAQSNEAHMKKVSIKRDKWRVI